MNLSGSKITFKSGLVTMILVVLVPFLLFQAYSYYESYRRRYFEELKTNMEVAHASAKLFEQFVAGILRQEAGVGQTMSSSKAISLEHITSAFSELRKQNQFIRNFSWVNPEGVVLASDLPEAVGYDLSQESFIQAIRNGSDWHIGDLYRSAVTNDLFFSISKAVRSASGTLQAIVVANIDGGALDRELSFHRTKEAGISIIDRRGMLVYSFPGKTLTWEQRNMLQACPSVQIALDGQEHMGSNFSPINGKEMVVAHVPMSFGWVACASRTKEEAVAPIYESLLSRILLFIGILSVAIILPLIISRRLAGSIGKLKKYADAVGRGEYNRYPENFGISEFQFLADSFRNMADKVAKREEALAKEQKVLDDIVRSTDVMLVYLDRDYNLIAVNPAYAKACRKTPGELIGKSHFDLFPHKENHEIFQRVRDTGLTAYYKNRPFMNPNQPERGITYWDWSLSPIKGGNGELAGFSLAMRDTTQYNKDQDSLRLHARILESMTEGVVVTNEQAIIIYTNTAEDAMFGYAPEELIGKHISLLNDYPPEENQKIIGSVIDQLLGHGSWKGQLCHRKKDGSVFYTHSYISRLNLNNRVFFVAVQIDITEEKRIKESLLEAKSELKLANEQLEQKVSHRTRELKNATVLLETAYMQLDRRAAKLRALANELANVEQGVRKQIAKILHDHLQQVLVATKLRVEGLQLAEEAEAQNALADLVDLLKEAIQITRSVTVQLCPPIRSDLPDSLRWLVNWMQKQHNFAVRLEVEEGLPGIQEEIRFFLFEASRELLFNAVKHAGVPAAAISLRQTEKNEIRLEVSDNGLGFDPENLKEAVDCQGFGLFSVMERVQLFDGSIEIDSSPGKGSRFSITIPLKASKQSGAYLEAEWEPASSSSDTQIPLTQEI